MQWDYFGATIIFVLIGYLIGSLSFSIIISKFKFNEDVREKGSGNAGATNVLRNYGKKTALVVFLLDTLKPVISALIAYSFKVNFSNFLSGILIQAVAFAAIIGHIFPIYFKFKGGKGASTIVGMFLVVNWILVIIGTIIFLLTVYKFKIVSIASIIVPLILILFQIVFMYIPHMNDSWSNPIAREPILWVNTIFLILAWLIIIYKHKENIKRLLNGTERKIKI